MAFRIYWYSTLWFYAGVREIMRRIAALYNPRSAKRRRDLPQGFGKNRLLDAYFVSVNGLCWVHFSVHCLCILCLHFTRSPRLCIQIVNSELRIIFLKN
jgi:hypothetical protein